MLVLLLWLLLKVVVGDSSGAGSATTARYRDDVNSDVGQRLGDFRHRVALREERRDFRRESFEEVPGGEDRCDAAPVRERAQLLGELLRVGDRVNRFVEGWHIEPIRQALALQGAVEQATKQAHCFEAVVGVV